MQDRDINQLPPTGDVTSLEAEVRVLRERLAFYEGFDLLIQDNVAHARELFRLAAQVREEASAEVDRARQAAAERQALVRAELEVISSEVGELASAVESLSRRVALALDEQSAAERQPRKLVESDARSVAVVAHGVASARSALSLQRFVASLPQVAAVTAKEFAGGVLRLDARVRDPLMVDHIQGWDSSRPIHLLTERPDVVEFALEIGSG